MYRPPRLWRPRCGHQERRLAGLLGRACVRVRGIWVWVLLFWSGARAGGLQGRGRGRIPGRERPSFPHCNFILKKRKEKKGRELLNNESPLVCSPGILYCIKLKRNNYNFRSTGVRLCHDGRLPLRLGGDRTPWVQPKRRGNPSARRGVPHIPHGPTGILTYKK